MMRDKAIEHYILYLKERPVDRTPAVAVIICPLNKKWLLRFASIYLSQLAKTTLTWRKTQKGYVTVS
jgi:hypothetical protein